MAGAQDSGSCACNDVDVQAPSRAVIEIPGSFMLLGSFCVLMDCRKSTFKERRILSEKHQLIILIY